tara:strand:+ start:4829 stop:5065 length:237 start_codon:yes stop_codon:yes gene_type:complete
MNEYKTAFKNKCTECIWKMINDDTVEHEKFYRQTKSIELLWQRFKNKVETLGSLLGYNSLYKEYCQKLDVVHSEALSN